MFNFFQPSLTSVSSQSSLAVSASTPKIAKKLDIRQLLPFITNTLLKGFDLILSVQPARYGNSSFYIYDSITGSYQLYVPGLQESILLASEKEVRAWLEQLYCR